MTNVISKVGVKNAVSVFTSLVKDGISNFKITDVLNKDFWASAMKKGHFDVDNLVDSGGIIVDNLTDAINGEELNIGKMFKELAITYGLNCVFDGFTSKLLDFEKISLESDKILDSSLEVNLLKNSEILSNKYISDEDIEYANKIIEAFELEEVDLPIVYTIIAALKNDSVPDDLKLILSNFDKLKEIYPRFQMCVHEKGSKFLGPMSVLYIDKITANLGPDVAKQTFFHEFGHGLLHMTYGEGLLNEIKLSAQQIDIIENSRKLLKEDIFTVQDVLKYVDDENEAAIKNVHEWYETIRDVEEDKIIKLLDEAYEKSDNEFISNLVSNSLNSANSKIDFKGIKDILKDAGMDNVEADVIISNRELVETIILKQNEITKKVEYKEMLMGDYSKYGDGRKMSSMLNSLLMSSESITSTDGRRLYYTFGHGDKYWLQRGEEKANVMSYDELFADFVSLKMNGRTDALEMFKGFAGDELYGDLDTTLNNIIKKIIEKLEGV